MMRGYTQSGQMRNYDESLCSKWTKDYAQSRQYHTIVESRVHLTKLTIFSIIIFSFINNGNIFFP